jgi:hypothetical protein
MRRIQLIAGRKEMNVLNLRLKEQESILSSKITEMHTLESKLSSTGIVKTWGGTFFRDLNYRPS